MQKHIVILWPIQLFSSSFEALINFTYSSLFYKENMNLNEINFAMRIYDTVPSCV